MIRSFLAALSLATAPTTAAEPVGLTADEFKMYRHYLNAMEDSRVQAMKPEARLGAIAKDAKLDAKKLKAAIAAAEGAGDFKAKCEANIKAALAGTDVLSRVSKVEVDITEPHAVAYVQWASEATEKLNVEASVIAGSAAPACPLLSSIQVWAVDAASPKTRVYQALISASAAARIQPTKAKDFADTRYVRLFEKVKSAANGDDLTAEPGSPAAGSAP